MFGATTYVSALVVVRKMSGTTPSHGRSEPHTRLTSQSAATAGQAQRDRRRGGVSPAVPACCRVEHGKDQIADPLTLRSVLPSEQRPCVRTVEQPVEEIPLVPVNDVDRVAIEEQREARRHHHERSRNDPCGCSRTYPRGARARGCRGCADHGVVSGARVEKSVIRNDRSTRGEAAQPGVEADLRSPRVLRDGHRSRLLWCCVDRSPDPSPSARR